MLQILESVLCVAPTLVVAVILLFLEFPFANKNEQINTLDNMSLNRVAVYSEHHKAAILIIGTICAVAVLVAAFLEADVLYSTEVDPEKCASIPWKVLGLCIINIILLGVLSFWLINVSHTKRSISTVCDVLDLYSLYGLIGMEHIKSVLIYSITPVLKLKFNANQTMRYYFICKSAYHIIWFVCTTYVVFTCINILHLSLMSHIILTVLSLEVLLINRHSFLSCCIYVWVLREIASNDSVCKVKYLKMKPELTPSYQRLIAISNQNSVTFLLVTLAISIAGILCVMLVPGALTYEMLLALLIVTGVGVTGFFVIFIGSKLFLGRILNSWRQQECDDWIKSRNRMINHQNINYQYTPITLYSPDPMSTSDRMSILIATFNVIISLAAVLVKLLGGQ